jgi:hypothetical protein
VAETLITLEITEFGSDDPIEDEVSTQDTVGGTFIDSI